ncbi:hypothetical protein K435DRAFT_973671 [Dendrothele bispora CBS 962.96]|uniref:Hydrophobic surface binding protein n=1 Tax=Dendrothele bispora (strain CBS 962.96) TaxID=1314807 RepID=A0A4S8KQT0_DENBC|nr:hypothetical protein K435DRAFT_973671 [Dendrothele bispora CBS 962.96]
MARFLFTILSFALALLTISVEAAPLQARQVGGIACNVARLQIVTDLAQTNKLLGQVDTTDPATADAVSTAQSGLDSASDGIKTIAGALITGQTAPADARDQVGTGLNDALTALTGLNSADPAVSDTVSKLNQAIDAGNQVVSTCK